MAKTFGFESTTDEVLEGVDLSGKRVLITGVSAGLGVETARAVVAHGGTVVGTARDLQKARRALAAALPPGASVELVEADLASLSSVRKAADELLAQGNPFDVARLVHWGAITKEVGCSFFGQPPERLGSI